MKGHTNFFNRKAKTNSVDLINYMTDNNPENDQIFDYDQINNRIKNEITNLKEYSFKHMVYSGIKIPSQWRVKQDYESFAHQTLLKDPQFLGYLINAGNSYTDPQEAPQIARKILSARVGSIRTNRTKLPTVKQLNDYDTPRLSESHKTSIIKSSPKQRPPFLIKNARPTLQQQYGPFLNIDYENLNKKIEIKNPTIKKLFEDNGKFGPYYSFCPHCSKKNVEFFKHIGNDEGVKLLNYIKSHKNDKGCAKRNIHSATACTSRMTVSPPNSNEYEL